MTSKVFYSILSKSFLKIPKRLKDDSWSLYKPVLTYFVPGRCCSALNSNLLNVPEVQNYLNFIESQGSSLEHLSNLPSDNIQNIKMLLQKKRSVEVELENLFKMSSEGDAELEKLIKEEKSNFMNEIEKIRNEILNNITISNEDDSRDVEIQIIPAVGGDEAKLFAEELYDMYLKYAEYKNWECSIAELKKEKNDFRSAHIYLSGYLVHKYMKHEAGVHRVQRVPETEKQGRTHTSTCGVVVSPQPKLGEININMSDVIVEKMRSSGPGGQNVNKTESCIRIKHIPTGVVVENQTSRFQYENKKLAFQRLAGILFNMQKEKVMVDKKNLKKQQIKTIDYSDKIRTYNFNQNRVTDHRINYSVNNLKGFMLGGKELDRMVCKIDEVSKVEALMEHIGSVLKSVEYKTFEKTQFSN